MNESFSISDFLDDRQTYKKVRQKKYREDSKERLANNIKKKIQTTMIGSLSTIEEKLGYLWGHNNPEELTEEQKEFSNLFQEIRSEILDRGNSQCRNVDAELSEYDVNWNRQSFTLPVRPIIKSVEKKEL